MAEAENLFDVLHCSELDQAEFEQVVVSYYGHGYHAQPQEIHHARAGAAARCARFMTKMASSSMFLADLTSLQVKSTSFDAKLKPSY